MHKTICSNCGKDCEVPFKPSGEKPVYCNECFDKKGRDSGSRRFESRITKGNNFEFRGNDQPQNNDQFNQLNAKIDKILSILQTHFSTTKSETKPEIEITDIVDIPVEKIPADEKKTKKPKKAATKTSKETH